MSKLERDKTLVVLPKLVQDFKDKKLSQSLALELTEAVTASGSNDLKAQMAALKDDNSPIGNYLDALYGGNRNEGRNIFMYNSTAQCTRCHAVGTEGSNVGPNLANIGNTLNREQLLQAMIEPSARLAPGYGTVILKLKDGQEVTGILMKETETDLTIKTNDAEPLHIQVSRIAKRENVPSSMPEFGSQLSKREIRDVVEYLSTLKKG